MGVYEVTFTFVAYIAAESEQDALRRATSSEQRDIVRNEDPYIEVTKHVTKVEDLGHGWDGECLAYGLNGTDMSVRRVIEG